MSPIIRISEDIYRRLQSHAEPFTDTPASVIERLLDSYESTSCAPKTDSTPSVLNTKRPSGDSKGIGVAEVRTFARDIGAKDIREISPGIFRRPNYYLLPPDTYLIIKVSNSLRPFFGLGEKFVEHFDSATEQRGTYFFVGLDSENSGWLLSKSQLTRGIADRSISRSEVGEKSEYKINYTDFRDTDRFLSIEDFREKVRAS